MHSDDTRLDPAHANYAGPLISGCVVCKITSAPKSCPSCQLVLYCSHDHQNQNQACHEASCRRIANAQKNLEQQRQRLHSLVEEGSDAALQQDPFESFVGYFWRHSETQRYIMALAQLGQSQFETKTVMAVQASLATYTEIFRLCRLDDLNIHMVLGVILLRLGQDQECYEWLKWYDTIGRGGFGFEDVEIFHLDLTNTDVLEPIRVLDAEQSTLSELVPLFLLKLRCLLDIQSIHNSNVLHGKLPPEIIEDVLENLDTNAMRRRRNSIKTNNPTKMINDLENQLKLLYKIIQNKNPSFWPLFLDPGNMLSMNFKPLNAGRNEVQLVLWYNYSAWMENPQAMSFFKRNYYPGDKS